MDVSVTMCLVKDHTCEREMKRQADAAVGSWVCPGRLPSASCHSCYRVYTGPFYLTQKPATLFGLFLTSLILYTDS